MYRFPSFNLLFRFDDFLHSLKLRIFSYSIFFAIKDNLSNNLLFGTTCNKSEKQVMRIRKDVSINLSKILLFLMVKKSYIMITAMFMNRLHTTELEKKQEYEAIIISIMISLLLIILLISFFRVFRCDRKIVPFDYLFIRPMFRILTPKIILIILVNV